MAAKALPAAMVAPFVVTAAPVPSVMVTASAVPMPVAMTAPMLDLNHAAIRRGHRGHAQPGGRGNGHCQRSKQRSSNQNETSHLVFLPIALSRSGTSSRGIGLFLSADTKSKNEISEHQLPLIPAKSWRKSPRPRQRDAEAGRFVPRARTRKVGRRDRSESVSGRRHRRRASCRPQRGHHYCHRLHSTPACSRRPIRHGGNMAVDEDRSSKQVLES